jgi:signal transduction histidine kinase
MDGDAGKVNETQRKLLSQAFNSSQKMVYLIADLLNVSRLKTGKFTIERKPTNLSLLVRDEVEQLKEEAAGRKIALDYEAPETFPILPLDDTKTRQVLMNFIDNAIYYTQAGGHIRVELKETPKSVEFRVIDDGIGVPKDERHHLFTKFYRAKNALRARPDGTGLGLYMSRKVITAQGGAIIFDSEEGKGSTFGFIFPKELPTEPVALPPQTRD